MPAIKMLDCRDTDNCENCAIVIDGTSKVKFVCTLLKRIMSTDNPDSAYIKHLFMDEPRLLKLVTDLWTDKWG